jgi:hypothetical protein
MNTTINSCLKLCRCKLKVPFLCGQIRVSPGISWQKTNFLGIAHMGRIELNGGDGRAVKSAKRPMKPNVGLAMKKSRLIAPNRGNLNAEFGVRSADCKVGAGHATQNLVDTAHAEPGRRGESNSIKPNQTERTDIGETFNIQHSTPNVQVKDARLGSIGYFWIHIAGGVRETWAINVI